MISRVPRHQVAEQLRFFSEKRAGCLFAAVAAHDPEHYGWSHLSLSPSETEVDEALEWAINDPATTTLSMVFSSVQDSSMLGHLVSALRRANLVRLDLVVPDGDVVCLGFRAVVGVVRSYITGFAPLDFLPATRRAPFCELTVRVKPRPNYAYVFKPAPAGVIHLADLDMKGMSPVAMRKLWNGSFDQTARILGAPADGRSAARTTFCVPINHFSNDDYKSLLQTGAS
jgi:hypothetical protein